ncbi:GntR family transcriptional regulator [Nocardioides sp.]|uniref:GntR family transcriptional regulator n=1 Tax=Nocardioides sp. TaxID=35761 RepID=UPI002629E074|nr:GntR family transcriptional regulator [Nocardioides sp.]MCW2736849.1 GntR family transcriptional regulator [Nocardioides sp.]
MTSARRGTIRRDINLPYYEQLKHLILQQIQDDGLRPGDLLPSEAEVGERYGVSRTVVRQAIGELAAAGVLSRRRGKGTFVSEHKIREQFMESTVGFFEDLTGQGHEVLSEVISVGLVRPASHVATTMELPDDHRVIEVVRLRRVDEMVVALVKSYINSDSEELLDHLRSEDLAHASLYRILENTWGLRIESGKRSLEATKAEGMLARLLEVGAGDPVLYIESVGRDEQGEVVEYFQAWHRADRSRLEISVVRHQSGLTSTLA